MRRPPRTGSQAIDRADPAAILARYHARHEVRSLVCPVCASPARRVHPASPRG